MTDRETISERLAEAGLDADGRFVDVLEGGKASIDHDNRHRDPPAGNYGIYATAADRLVLLDIDDYEDIDDRSGLSALGELPATLEQASPHGGTHRIYRVDVSDDGRFVAAVLSDEFDTDKGNPAPSWGEVRAANQYVVGAGSELDGCDKDGCEACADPDGGRYTVQADRQIATISLGTLVDVLSADPSLDRDEESADLKEFESGENDAGGAREDVENILAYALDESDHDKLRRLWRGNHGDDRSEAECRLAAMLGWWLGGGRSTAETKRLVAEVFDGRHVPDGWRRPKVSKWAERDDDSYRDSVLEAVETVDDPFTPRPDSGQDYDPATPPGATADGSGVDTDDRGGEDEFASVDDELELAPWAVSKEAYADEKAHFRVEEDAPTVADLKTGERAYYTWRVAEEIGVADELLAVNQGPIHSYDSGVWDDENGEQRLRQVGREALRHEYTGQVLDELEEQLRATRTFHRDELGVGDGKVAVANGLLDLDERETRELEPDDLAIRRLPVEFDPTTECPRWEEYIGETVPPRWHDAIQEFVGYCLCFDELPIHRALMLVGGGANGKSVFLDVVQSLLGEENVGNKSLQKLAGDEHARAELHGKVANIDNDLSSRSLDVGMFKKTTGNNRIDARELYQEGFQYRATFKQLYAANQVPDVPADGLDDAFFRRWLIVEFPNHFPKGSEQRDPRLAEKLKEELSGILNWALDGRDRLLEQGYFTNETAQDTRQRWRSWGDSISQFVEENVEEVDGRRVTAANLYNQYAEWCRNDLGQSPEPQQTVTSKVKGATSATYKQSLRTADGHSSGFDGLHVAYDPDESEGANAGLGDLEDSRKVVKAIVEREEPEHDAGVPAGMIYEQAASAGWDETRTENAIDRCLRNGIIEEPAEGRFRTV